MVNNPPSIDALIQSDEEILWRVRPDRQLYVGNVKRNCLIIDVIGVLALLGFYFLFPLFLSGPAGQSLKITLCVFVAFVWIVFSLNGMRIKNSHMKDETFLGEYMVTSKRVLAYTSQKALRQMPNDSEMRYTIDDSKMRIKFAHQDQIMFSFGHMNVEDINSLKQVLELCKRQND